MVAPSKSFTLIPDGDIDPDSPITTGLMTEFRGNDIHLEEWLGKDFVAAQNHDHDGLNSAFVSAAGGGALRLKERKEVTADTATVTFSGLAGETDEAYIIAGRIRAGNAALNAVVLRPNGVTVNLSSQVLNVDGATVTGVASGTTIQIGQYSGGVGTVLTFKLFFFARRTIQTFAQERQTIGMASFDGTGSAARLQSHSGLWNDTTTILTSIDIFSATTGIGKGSNIALYILRQS